MILRKIGKKYGWHKNRPALGPNWSKLEKLRKIGIMWIFTQKLKYNL